MTPRQIITLVLRLLALAGLLYTIGQFATTLAYIDNAQRDIDKTFFALIAIAQCLLWALMWFYPASIAKILLPSALSDEIPATSKSPLQWQTMGVICIALFTLSKAIPDAIYWLSYYRLLSYADFHFMQFSAEDKAGMIATAFELLLGLVLLLGGKVFAAALFKVRTAGVK